MPVRRHLNLFIWWLIEMDVQAEIKKIMGPKETIELFVDSQNYEETTIDSLALTNERIIIGRENSQTSKVEYTVHKYTDISGVGLEKGFMRSIIRLRVKTGGESMDSIRLPPKLAEQTLGILKQKVCGITSQF
jgi:hypothetical protein